MDPETRKEAVFLPERKKMEALGRLSRRAAHDFNNILGAIEGYATLAAMDRPGGGAALTQDLGEIHAAVAKAAALAKQLLVFAGMQPLHKAPCGVNDIIRHALKSAQPAPGGAFRTEARLEPGLPVVTADSGHLQMALANLLANSREAMPGGGTAVISSSVLRLEGAAVNSPKPQEAGRLFIRISVGDGGGGIAPEVFEHLFEPLCPTGKEGRNAGLGLSFVYGVVRQHNGWVEVKSEPGRGAEFSIFLPAVSPGSGPPGVVS